MTHPFPILAQFIHFSFGLSLSLSPSVKTQKLSLSPFVEDQNLLPFSDLLSNSCSMSLICSQAHAQWLTTKLCRPKTLLTLSIGLKHFSPLLGVLETDFLVFWKLFFNVPYFFFFFFQVFWKLIFWVFWKLIFQVFWKLIFWVLEAGFCIHFFFLGYFGS